ncbi:beta-ketoacyl-[acyl-carrier-protein] synthase family protein [Rasiella rasia]|uniref:Beta-ketoacyl-[acyl-carrier-protein] synthase family protein n=1 Tax=Rasiella rasia TaxID=2744027 RepID=A0A6G6GNG1_9FLAO|nr:beta-ketoacyl-[acyl-carrier-protein] synthase family protein [Rasiella rasia]QIE60116.1 beta-ketoacyl-[acyl-carrier-protein] synthase family protein [Rasiella rasia]
MSNKIAITGIGIISALGTTVVANKAALLKGETGIGKLQKLDSIHAPSVKVGEVAQTNEQLAQRLNLSEGHNYTRTALLGSVAALDALKHASIDKISSARTGLISATTVGGMDKTEQYFKHFINTPESRKYIASHHAGDSTQKIADELGINDFTTTISTACSSAANAIMLGARMINTGQLDRVVVGGTDALSKFTINGFKSLMLLSDTYCKPFDANRNGLNLGEAAAYLVLESETVATGKSILGYVSGYGNANDAHHQTASSETGEGAFLAMRKALKVANLNPEDISYINAHGTATPNNDLSESVALQRIFGANLPSFSSTKGFTGHTLAAAGAVEAVFSVLALQEQCVFPNINFETEMPETLLSPITKFQKKTVTHVLSNSFGFGGNCTALVFSKS